MQASVTVLPYHLVLHNRYPCFTCQPNSNHCQINRTMKENLYDDLYQEEKEKKLI